MKEAARLAINITELIRDYRMMKREIDRLQNILYGRSVPMRSWGVAQWGIEATLPKGSAGKSQAELKDMDIREQKQIARLEEYQRRVYAIESAGDYLDREILKVVYDCMLDGMTRQEIAVHLEMSRDSVDKLRSDIKAQIGTNTTFSKLLHGEKFAV
ncbi:sigma-70 family RNA polymerase sigma factor [Cytobacillus oceanisediminis]|uniref:sigma-70 family RNA polymerase sigma factor n=1 Tax=Cytobacillus oceanisediminis TaxID=665099 RepID=UPI001C21FB82|nr:sigma-70 family RNA polymerase sigma factor [Cytobacillus oceanisediminis]MBU8733448.1 sigma-70 family RNA polymerase sigma factor [Cytobacillus oceanisediminis]